MRAWVSRVVASNLGLSGLAAWSGDGSRPVEPVVRKIGAQKINHYGTKGHTCDTKDCSAERLLKRAFNVATANNLGIACMSGRPTIGQR
jgi:hypothetical protein